MKNLQAFLITGSEPQDVFSMILAKICCFSLEYFFTHGRRIFWELAESCYQLFNQLFRDLKIKLQLGFSDSHLAGSWKLCCMEV